MNRNRLMFMLLTLLCALSGLFIGWKTGRPIPRTVNPARVEGVLSAYIDHRKNSDDVILRRRLDELKVTPADFTRIIDRFIHYRMRQSSMQQAMTLLEAFRSGYHIEASGIFSKEAEGEVFALDAEVLTVFQQNPGLVQKAFGS
ncbi:MAG: hypothetical protein HQM09_20485 [Candidatus Riflebacteria bacterium]|nr:hypothetical protein [Candidatus Riflebacteria bacterium]